MNNPRFPHTCTISVYVGNPIMGMSTDDNIVYHGVCRMSGATNIRTFDTGTNSMGKVNTADWRVSIPGIVRVPKGAEVSVFTPAGDEEKMRVVNVGSTLLGSYVEKDQNTGETTIITGGTELICAAVAN